MMMMMMERCDLHTLPPCSPSIELPSLSSSKLSIRTQIPTIHQYGLAHGSLPRTTAQVQSAHILLPTLRQFGALARLPF
jgi:hypothetical protein